MGQSKTSTEPGILFEERNYKMGVKHGIQRSWNPDKSLMRAYPQLYYEGTLIECNVDKKTATQFGFELRESDNTPRRHINPPSNVQIYVSLS